MKPNFVLRGLTLKGLALMLPCLFKGLFMKNFNREAGS